MGRALLWLGPSLALIAAVVIYPAVELVRASLGRYSITGLYQGAVGLRNYTRLLEQEALPTVVANTVTWVVLVVGITIAISLGLAQLLDASFPGRRLVRWALIVPWAASLNVHYFGEFAAQDRFQGQVFGFSLAKKF